MSYIWIESFVSFRPFVYLFAVRTDTVHSRVNIYLSVAIGTQSIEWRIDLNKVFGKGVTTIQSSLLIHHLNKRDNILHTSLIKVITFTSSIVKKVGQ